METSASDDDAAAAAAAAAACSFLDTLPLVCADGKGMSTRKV